MNSKIIAEKISATLIILILFLSMWLYSGIHNAEQDFFSEITYKGLTGDVKVYRDQYGVPSIVGQNLLDLVYAQGYEYARNQGFQLEFYRSLINGELSRLFGSKYINTDIFLREIGLKRAALYMQTKLNTQELDLIKSYVQGVNDYYKDHPNNIPFELELLGVKPKEWQISDTIAMGSIVAFTFAFSGLGDEILRQDVVKRFGNEKALELFPVDYKPAYDYLLNYSDGSAPSVSSLSQNLNNIIQPLLGNSLNSIANSYESNNWVISGNKTMSGYPIVANDPHTNLAAQGIWNRINLFTTDGQIQLQGLTFPGVPLLAFGHNKYVAWGATSGILDSVDLFYLKQNKDGTQYLENNTIWKNFDTINTQIPVNGGKTVNYTIKISDFGPIVNTTDGVYAMDWTLLNRIPRDNPIKSLLGFNTATSVDDMHEALRYMLTGFNFVFADMNGNIGYQQTGIIPIRKTGYGLLPHNGSNGEFGWTGYVNYDDQLYIKNPASGFFATANQRVDTRNLYYTSEAYALRYRIDRINQILANGTDFSIQNTNKFTIQDVMHMQADVKTLVAEDLLNPVKDILKTTVYNQNQNLMNEVINTLLNWDQRMSVNSVGALIFGTYRLFLDKVVFQDELTNLTDSYAYESVRTIATWLKTNRTISWFDNKNTPQIETATDCVKNALAETVDYLSKNFGTNLNNWKWGDKHRVILPHIFHGTINLFDIGGSPSGGSTFTINAIAGPELDDNSINYISSYGPYFRLVMEVNPSWDNVWGITSSGISSNPLSGHYSDSYYAWINFQYQRWFSNLSEIQANYKLTAIYRSA